MPAYGRDFAVKCWFVFMLHCLCGYIIFWFETDMENFIKGKNVENELKLCDLPYKEIPSNTVWIKVKPSSKMSNLIEFGLESILRSKWILWTGIGPAICKTISCAEIMKRKISNVNQNTKVAYHKCEEYWDSKTGELDSVKVTRNIPVIHILMSLEYMDTAERGFQSNGHVVEMA
nr:EOG090X0KMN [Megafenestra aurita]